MTDPKQPSRLSILWSYAQPHLPTLVLGLVLALIGSAMGLASPLVTKWILDSLAVGTSLREPVLVLVGLFVVGSVISWWQWILLGTLAENIVYEARGGMIRRYLYAKVQPLLTRPTGELVTRVTSDSLLLREAASSSIIGLFNGVVMLVGSLVLMGVLDLPLLLTTMVAVVIVVIVFVTLMPAIAHAQERAQASLGSLGGELEGTLRAIKTVKVAGAEDRRERSLREHAAEARRHSIRAVRREALVWTIAWAGVQAAIIVILGVGAWRVSLGEMSVSTLIAFLLYAFGLLGPIMELSANLTSLQSGIAAAGRIREVDQLPLEQGADAAGPARVADAEGAPSASALSLASPVLELRGVTARYRPEGAPAVQDIELTIPRRGHTAVVGPSGAGKTSLLSLVLRFIEPEAGELRIDGMPYRDLSARQVRERLAYVEQETPVVPGTIRENLLFANPAAGDDAVRRVLAEIRLDDAIARLPEGLDSPLSDTSVSGGQRQRIALARAILADPDVLLLDEATAQVDGITEAAIHEAIRRRARDHAVVTVAHRLSTVIDADQIVVMDAGRIVARGTHTELLETTPLYRGLVEALSLETAAT